MKKKKIIYKIIIIVVFLILIIALFKIASNFIKENDYSKLNVLINNTNVTKRLKYEPFKDENGDIYLSKDDLKNFFDKYLYVENDKIITTYDKKVSVFYLNKNQITINGVNKTISAGAIKKDEVIYLPITQMATSYNLDINYVTNTNILILDSLERALTKAEAVSNIKVKVKKNTFSSTVAKVKKGEKVVLIDKGKKWSKVRTIGGFVGYIKTSKIDNEVIVRNAATKEQNVEKINMIWDYYSEYVSAPDRTGTTIDGVNVVSPSFFYMINNGNSAIGDNAGAVGGKAYVEWAKANNYKVWAMVSNNSYKDTTSKMLSTYETRNTFINGILNLAVKYNLNGINIDFENMYEEDKALFSRFIIELAPRLKEYGMILSVDVIAPDGGSSWSECYERNVIGDVADYVVFMAYDQYSSGSKSAGTTAGYNWIETNLNKFINREEVDSNKLILGIPFYTRLWKEQNENVSSNTVNMNKIEETIPKEANRVWNDDLKQYYVEYIKNNITYKMWIEDETSIRYKVSLVNKYDLAGVAAWEKDRETENIWQVIKEELSKQINE